MASGVGVTPVDPGHHTSNPQATPEIIIDRIYTTHPQNVLSSKVGVYQRRSFTGDNNIHLINNCPHDKTPNPLIRKMMNSGSQLHMILQTLSMSIC